MEKGKELDALLEKIQNDDENPYSIDYYDLDNPNPFEWKILLEGPNDTPYENGYFVAKIIFPKDYPNSAPTIYFKTKIYHLNVNPDSGKVCFGNYDHNSIEDRIEFLYTFFVNQNPESPYGTDRAKMYTDNRSKFNEIARDWTRKYANMDDCDVITFDYFPK